MPESFRERVDTASAIKGILDSYPYGNGLAREIIQNSDDAGATQQILTLDCRQHPTSSLVDPALASTQGPALLCENDSVFRESDWVALRTIHGSNKKADESKIGKYGLGFRSCYHITDNPHILSAGKLVVFDPHEEFAQPGGISIDICKEGDAYPNQLSAFHPSGSSMVNFSGTIIRLPLRTPEQASRSRIMPKSFCADDIRGLFDEFVEKELGLIMLFLKHIHSIELREISPQGDLCSRGKVYIDKPDSISQQRAMKRDLHARFETFRCTVVSTHGESTTWVTWRICHSISSEMETAQILSSKLGYDASQRLSNDKLFSHVALAYPLQQSIDRGRLFTLLPLPIYTDLPLHLHAILALTPDRQALRNREETGAGNDSRERLLIKWNLAVFDTFAPRAWAHLLDVLVEHSETPDIWSAWPDSSKTGNLYWENLPHQLALEVAEQDLAIFPKIVAQDVGSGTVYVGLRDSLVASAEFSEGVLRVLAKAGLVIIQPPLSVLRLLKLADHQILTRSTIHRALQARISLVENLEPTQKILLLDFLLGPYTPTALYNIAGLPLVPTVSGTFVALSPTNSANYSYILATNEMIKLFRHLDPTMIDAPTLTPRTLSVFLSPSSFLNAAPLSLHRLQILLEQQIPPSMAGTFADPDMIQWICSFWTWVEGRGSWLRVPTAQQLHAALERHVLLLTTAGQLRAVQSGYLATSDLDNETCNVLCDIGVPLLDKRIPDVFLRSHRVARDPTYVGYVLETLNAHAVTQLSDTNRHVLQAYLAAGKRKVQSQHLSTYQLSVLKGLPIFPVLLSGSNEPVAATAALSGNIVFVKTTSCPLPTIHAATTTFVDVSDRQPSREIALLVDNFAFLQSLDELAILRLAVTVLANQTDEDMDILMSRIVRRLMDLGDSHIRQLKEVAFVLVEDGTRRVASFVVDPYSSVQPLFKGETDRIPAGPYTRELFPPLQQFQFFLQTLTASVVHERIGYISARSRNGDAALFSKATCLLNLLASQYPQLSSTLQDSVLRTSVWMPTTAKRLCKPEGCRSASSTEEELLFDLAIPLVAVQINSASLRKALGWDPLPSLEVILDQMRRSLELVPSQKAEKRLRSVISHLGTQFNQGLITQAHLSAIAIIVAGKAWIPVGGRFARTHHAVLSQSEDVDFRGSFRRVHCSSFSSDVIPFLKAMGCEEMPTLGALVEEIATVVKSSSVYQSHILQLLEQCSTVLSSYSDETWPSEVDDILIPVTSQHKSSMFFQPLHSVHYDDLPASSISSYPGYPFRCHSWVSKGLARGLKIPFASDLRFSADGDDDDLDDLEMGEDFCSRISGVLKDYDINYAINEFIANAVDAGATRLSVFLDERSFGSNVLSPDVARFQGPALVIYNDALFEPKDFDGIRNVGTGGKTEEADTIGRFGLGALSLFHFTDLPMIVSGSKAMFLDPSGEYLPRKNGNRRTSIHRTIHSLSSKYPDQMAPFESFDEFSNSTNYLSGTVFRLPLRKKPSKLSSTSTTAPDVIQLLKSSYLELASSALMFTSLEHVDAVMISPERDFGDRLGKRLWSVIKHIEKPVPAHVVTKGHTVQHETVLVTTSRPLDRTLDKQRWFISRLHYPVALVPSEHTTVLERHKLLRSERGLRCGLAFPLQNRTGVRTPSYLFSTMRLPVTTSLPAHVDAQFALSPDRRSIRHDPPDPTGHRIPEAQYNNWLLTELIPLVYHYSLAHIESDKRAPWLYWPDAQKDEVSRTVVNGFFGSLMKTDHAILPTSQGHLLKPSDAVLAHSGHPPPRVCTVLATFHDSNLIQSPPSISSRLKNGGMILANPQYVRDTLALRRNTFYNWCVTNGKTRPFMESILCYLLDGTVSPSGLPLLRLQDRSIVDVPASSAISYYVHDHDLSHLLPANRFLSFKYSKHSKKLLVANCSGVSNLTATAVNAMIKEKIGVSSRLLLAPPLEEWVRELWRTMLDDETVPKLDTCSTFASLPLFRTHDGQYISLQFAKSHAVLPPPFDTLESWTSIAGIIDQLGIIILPEDRQNKGFFKEYFSLAILVQKMIDMGTYLYSLTEEDRATLAHWVRREMGSAFSAARDQHALRKAYRSLPVWPARRGAASVLVSAENVVVLPRNIALDLVQPYLVPHIAFSEFSHDLKGMDFREKIQKNKFVTHSVNSIDADNIYGYLQLPDVLPPDRIVSYKTLLTSILDITSEIRVPDGNLHLRRVTDLYDDTNPILMSSLAGHPEYFVYADFRDLQRRLIFAGLRHVITPDVYETCVRVLDGDLNSPGAGNTTDVYTQRATLLFSYFKEQLPLGVLMSAWNSLLLRLRGLKFIPRLVHRRDRVVWDTVRYSTSHPLIVAPQDVVLQKDSRVCWTQNVLCDETSMHAVLFQASPPVFGIITVDSVVAHLLVLTLQVAEDHAGDTELLGDISATYRWLEDHDDPAQVSMLLARHSDDAIFLNVDDPRSQQWTFLPASALVFGLALDENGLFTVREYLSSRKALLTLAGVQTLSVPAYRSVASTASTDATIRVKYDEMRLSGKHCDVVFEPTEGDIPPDSPDRLRAHISFLAANVPHLDEAFESDMSERATGRYHFKGTFFGAHAVLDFVYTQDIVLQTPQTSEELGELLGHLLDLLETADAWSMPRLKDHVGVLIIRHGLLTPETNSTIHKDALKYGASQLVALCEEFAEKNSRILSRLG